LASAPRHTMIAAFPMNAPCNYKLNSINNGKVKR
jgi:hypothetical protein